MDGYGTVKKAGIGQEGSAFAYPQRGNNSKDAFDDRCSKSLCAARDTLAKCHTHVVRVCGHAFFVLSTDGTADGVFSECQVEDAGGSVRNDADSYVSIGCSVSFYTR